MCQSAPRLYKPTACLRDGRHRAQAGDGGEGSVRDHGPGAHVSSPNSAVTINFYQACFNENLS